MYKLVILGSDWDLYKYSYRDLMTQPSIYIPGMAPKNKILRFIFRVHMHDSINKIINLPFKSIWNSIILKNVSKNEKYVFLIFTLRTDNKLEIISYLRRNYKECKIVLFLQDLVNPVGYSGIDISSKFPRLDLVISYDPGDAKKYNLEYHNTIYSHPQVKKDGVNKYDILYIGKDKGRLPLLAKLYVIFTGIGLKCKFILLNVPQKDRVLNGKIDYINKMLPYKDVLEYVSHSSCLLEILQPTATGITYRTLEAISFDKKLITNNKSILSTGLFDNSNISIFNSVDDLNYKFLEKIKDNCEYDNSVKEKIKPINLIRFIENKLHIKIDL